ncbi:DUF2254 domain-containing protein [Thetidibacter halocola]|uniref:DUF2254 domain-containing protein n=1 Tax=Thetidibacter halocola TaxID=2827239 RepID=A0A8J8B5H2_9RHOB|nr:DUF2254 family protein [Thetidibacter halocola]MBS0122941.1 DUF2254 domain-containing protein [Thetidibacter halocola]
MILSILRRLRQLSRRIHVRVILLAILALLALAGAMAFGHMIPADLGRVVGADAVDAILQTLASSMLAVTIFSLTVMVTALNNAAAQWTPRSHLVLREDAVTHSVLANFLGAFLFSLVGIVMRAAGLFDDRGVVLLFFMTLGVVTLVMVSLIRWIVHLEGLGSLTDTAATLEAEAADALRRAARMPCHGGHALTEPGNQIPEDAVPIRARRSGYLQQVFEQAIQTEAEDKGLRVFVTVPVGGHVLEGGVLGFVAADRGDVGQALGLAARTVLAEALPLSALRSFEQDPLFGVTVLAEVGVRALSPGINDPGTAIDVAFRLSRVLAEARDPPADPPACNRLWAPPVTAVDCLHAAYDGILRHATDAPEVRRAVMQALDALAALEGARDMARAATAMAADMAAADA